MARNPPGVMAVSSSRPAPAAGSMNLVLVKGLSSVCTWLLDSGRGRRPALSMGNAALARKWVPAARPRPRPPARARRRLLARRGRSAARPRGRHPSRHGLEERAPCAHRATELSVAMPARRWPAIATSRAAEPAPTGAPGSTAWARRRTRPSGEQGARLLPAADPRRLRRGHAVSRAERWIDAPLQQQSRNAVRPAPDTGDVQRSIVVVGWTAGVRVGAIDQQGSHRGPGATVREPTASSPRTCRSRGRPP